MKTFKGTVELGRMFDKISDNLSQEQLNQMTYNAAKLIVLPNAKANCPAGRLRDSISVKEIDDGAAVYTNVPYASYVENGTTRMGARPYLYPALKNNMDSIVEEIKKEALETLEVE